MEFEIVEHDKDYRAITDRKIMDFPSLEAAKEYCKKESWSGYAYTAIERPTRTKTMN